MAAPVFYGWFVLAGAFAITFVGFGSAYTFSAFVHSLQTDFAASRGSVFDGRCWIQILISPAGCAVSLLVGDGVLFLMRLSRR